MIPARFVLTLSECVEPRAAERERHVLANRAPAAQNSVNFGGAGIIGKAQENKTAEES
jgi:hypothetical protein